MFDLLFPIYCINCGRPGSYLCTLCQKKLKNNLPECYMCRRISNRYATHDGCNKSFIDGVFVGWQYDNIAKKVMAQYKYRHSYKLSRILSELLFKRLKETSFIDFLNCKSILIPVPIHKSHQNRRGFNQSSLIAKRLSEKLNCSFREDIVLRSKDRSYQSKGDLNKRKSLGEVFEVSSKLHNENIVIVDDVITTGTTINKVAELFNGNSIKAIALFRGRPLYR